MTHQPNQTGINQDIMYNQFQKKKDIMYNSHWDFKIILINKIRHNNLSNQFLSVKLNLD